MGIIDTSLSNVFTQVKKYLQHNALHDHLVFDEDDYTFKENHFSDEMRKLLTNDTVLSRLPTWKPVHVMLKNEITYTVRAAVQETYDKFEAGMTIIPDISDVYDEFDPSFVVSHADDLVDTEIKNILQKGYDTL